MTQHPKFIPPALTGEQQRAAEFVAARADIYRTAHALMGALGMADDATAEDVLFVARFLAGEE